MNDIKAFEMRSVFIYRLIVPVSFYLLVYGEEKQCKRLHIKKIKKIKTGSLCSKHMLQAVEERFGST